MSKLAKAKRQDAGYGYSINKSNKEATISGNHSYRVFKRQYFYNTSNGVCISGDKRIDFGTNKKKFDFDNPWFSDDSKNRNNY